MPNDATSQGRHFRPDIQGLRALAVLLVIVAHSGFETFSGGFVGVDVFFVISGFLITSLLMREAATKGRISLARLLRPAGSADPAGGRRWSRWRRSCASLCPARWSGLPR